MDSQEREEPRSKRLSPNIRIKQQKEIKFNELMIEIQMVSLIKGKELAKRLSELSVLITQGNNEYVAKELQELSNKLIELAQYNIKGEMGNE